MPPASGGHRSVRPEGNRRKNQRGEYKGLIETDMSFNVYILLCSDKSYYTGHTDDLEARLGLHQSGVLAGYTKSRRPLQLVFSESFATRIEALEAERKIKSWSRAKKAALIAGDWDAIHELAARRTPDRER